MTFTLNSRLLNTLIVLLRSSTYAKYSLKIEGCSKRVSKYKFEGIWISLKYQSFWKWLGLELLVSNVILFIFYLVIGHGFKKWTFHTFIMFHNQYTNTRVPIQFTIANSSYILSYWFRAWIYFAVLVNICKNSNRLYSASSQPFFFSLSGYIFSPRSYQQSRFKIDGDTRNNSDKKNKLVSKWLQRSFTVASSYLTRCSIDQHYLDMLVLNLTFGLIYCVS